MSLGELSPTPHLQPMQTQALASVYGGGDARQCVRLHAAVVCSPASAISQCGIAPMTPVGCSVCFSSIFFPLFSAEALLPPLSPRFRQKAGPAPTGKMSFLRDQNALLQPFLFQH